jgi:hypothetical protein
MTRVSCRSEADFLPQDSDIPQVATYYDDWGPTASFHTSGNRRKEPNSMVEQGLETPQCFVSLFAKGGLPRVQFECRAKGDRVGRRKGKKSWAPRRYARRRGNSSRNETRPKR